ncbi:FMN-binding protein [Anoxynatronum sibiricum]|uniref:FMN-binding protein n=1 Tax=Anoxynatronum sibiricum TaxID=210623 RepID=A0ABU9VXL1_9CLOT
MLKKQMKGVLILMMVAVLTMGVLTACGGSGATEEAPAATPQTVTGTGQGYADDVVVEVTVLDGVIQSIEVVESADTPGLSDGAFDAVIEAVLENQSTDVDAVSGATGSSEGLLEAIKDALSKVE